MLDLVTRVLVRRDWDGQRGQGLVEYGLIIVFVSLVVIAAVSLFGIRVYDMVGNAANTLNAL